MDPAQNTGQTIESLIAKNKSLLEELTQCKADKEFVWNLWKRLQTAQPDLTSVVAMVVAREKEKIEDKDKKILGILQLKDEKIKELQEVLESGQDEVKYNKERYHDLLIANEELKQKLEERKDEESKREKDLTEENKHLSDLVNAHQLQNDNIKNQFMESTKSMEKEIEDLKEHISALESEVDKLSRGKSTLASVMEENTALQMRTEELQKSLEEITERNREAVRQNQDATATLKLREAQLQEQSKIVQEHAELLEVKNQEVAKLRQELSVSNKMQQELSEHMREQDVTIKELQNLQDDTQRVIAAREEAHSNEIMLLKKLVGELQDQLYSCEQAQNTLRENVEVLNKVNSQNEENIRVKEEVIKELKEALQGAKKDKSLSPSRTARHDADVCEQCDELKQRCYALEGEYDELREKYQQKLRRVSSLEKVVKSSLGGRSVDDHNVKMPCLEMMSEDTDNVTERWEATRRKLVLAEGRNNELKTLLDLKETELVEMKRVHGKRLQRYKLLQENYKLVLEQLKTFDAETGFKKEKELPERPASRALRHENSEGVWNELAYYKAEYEKLFQEREIDFLPNELKVYMEHLTEKDLADQYLLECFRHYFVSLAHQSTNFDGIPCFREINGGIFFNDCKIIFI